MFLQSDLVTKNKPQLSNFLLSHYHRVTNSHVIGTASPLQLKVIVNNKNEDSFNTKLWIDLPPGVSYDTISSVDSVVSPSCRPIDQGRKVECDLGNPMKKQAIVSLNCCVECSLCDLMTVCFTVV